MKPVLIFQFLTLFETLALLTEAHIPFAAAPILGVILTVDNKVGGRALGLSCSLEVPAPYDYSHENCQFQLCAMCQALFLIAARVLSHLF